MSVRAGPISVPDLRSQAARLRELDQDLGITISPLVELLIGLGRLINTDMVAYDFAGPCVSGDDEIAQVLVIALVIALDRTLPHADADRLVEQLRHGQRKHPALRLSGQSRVLCSKIGEIVGSSAPSDLAPPQRWRPHPRALKPRVIYNACFCFAIGPPCALKPRVIYNAGSGTQGYGVLGTIVMVAPQDRLTRRRAQPFDELAGRRAVLARVQDRRIKDQRGRPVDLALE